MGSMYTAVLFLGVQNSGSVQPVVSIDRTVFYRERAAGMYSAFPYAMAQVLTRFFEGKKKKVYFGIYFVNISLTNSQLLLQVVVELPYLLAQAVAYSIIVYSMIGFEWTVAKFFWYLFYTCLTLFQFTFFGMMAVGVTPNHHMAAIVSTAFYSVWNLFSGFMVPVTVSPLFSSHPHPESLVFSLEIEKNIFIFFFCITKNREFLYGGDGSTGHAQ
jgi:hypothetical protein